MEGQTVRESERASVRAGTPIYWFTLSMFIMAGAGPEPNLGPRNWEHNPGLPHGLQ